MKRKNIPFFLFMISIVVFSCSKEKSFEDPETGSNYMPQDTLHYVDTMSHSGFRLISTDSVKEMDGITFHAYKNIPDSFPEDTTYSFLGDSSGAYYVKSFLPEWGDQKVLILKQHAEEGDTWTNPFSVGGQSLDVTFKVVEKGISHPVYGQSFESVIHLEILINNPVRTTGGDSNESFISIGDVYFAPSVGIIQLNINNPLQEDTSFYLLLENIG
ncbi:MAG TPA: hypothetical protein VK084_03075 [Chitinophagaceae bacterium]|nr:hypothetical protein [Chitinophagaceae bacterium]